MKGLETFAIGTNKYLSKGLMVIRCLANFRLKTVNTLLNQKIILKKGTLMPCWWECRLMKPLWKTVWSFLKKLNMELPFEPAIPFQEIYPKNPETQV